MKYILSALSVFSALFLPAQQPAELIARVQQAQKQLRSVYYTLVRQDTLVTGHIRNMTGNVQLTVIPGDSIFGFRFHALPDKINGESIYDGHTSIYVDHDKKLYTQYTSPDLLDAITGFSGGQLVYKELVRIDTATALSFTISEDGEHYYLKVLLPDITRYDVLKRSKEYTISKKLMLPLAMRFHQETLGKVQDLYYKVTSITINAPELEYDFSQKRYPDDYRQDDMKPNRRLQSLSGKQLPSFSLVTFGGKELNSESLKGKLILLDFWEVWCGPCIASLPKIQELYNKYRLQGLEVSGIIHQNEHLAAAKLLAEKMKITFPLTAGNEDSRKKFSVEAVPLYILADRTGKIIMVNEGYPEFLEEMIKKNIQ